MSLEDLIHPFLGVYIASPQWFKSLVGEAYSKLPVAWRRGRQYAQFRAELAEPSSEWIRGLAQAKLAATLRHALTTVPAYREFHYLLAGLDAPHQVLAQLPVVSKGMIKSASERYLSDALLPSARLTAFTGGSTAEPMRFYLEKHVTRFKEYAFMEDFESRVGFVAGNDVVLALRGRTVPAAKQPSGRLWMFEPIKKQLILSSDHLEPTYMPQYMAALRRWKPGYIQAFPSALYPLARWLKAYPDAEITARIHGVLLYSENVYDFQMSLFREVFDCPVLKHYGHSERVLMAATLPDDDRYFFWPQYGHVELLDEAGNVITQPGVLGEIVGTSFDNRVMPFVRYRTGDLAMLSDTPHPALPGYIAVERIEGRLQEFIVTRDHRLISICTMGAAHFDELAEVEAIQYEQHEPGVFLLKIVSPRTLGDDVRARIARAVEEKTQNGCRAEVVRVESIPRTARGKHVMLVQHLDISHYLGAASEGEA
jgi:phenylacetate-CoA ligase